MGKRGGGYFSILIQKDLAWSLEPHWTLVNFCLKVMKVERVALVEKSQVG